MIEATYYQCEKCGTNYNTSDKAQECEAFHIAVDSVIRYKYNAKNVGPESKYPHAVVVRMADGKDLTFKR